MGVGKHVIEMTEQEQEDALDRARTLAPEFDKLGEKCDLENTFPFEIVDAYKAAKLPSLSVPKKYGGQGGDIWTLARVSYELAKGDPAIALAFNMHHVMVGILRGIMPEEAQEKWFTRIAEEEALMCGAFSEERAGFSGLADVTARPDGNGGLLISGKKVWATLSEAADIATFNATLVDEDGSLPEDHMERMLRERVFVTDKDIPGLNIIKTWDTHGMRATGTQTMAFDDAQVPAEAEVGLMRADPSKSLAAEFEWAALLFGGVYVGLTDKAYWATRDELMTKSLGATAAASDVPLREQGHVQHGLGEMRCKLEQSKRVLEMTAIMLIEGRDAEWSPLARPGLIDVVKATVTQNAFFVASNGMRLIGGSTFRRGHTLERLYRDSRSGPFQPMTTDQTYDHLGKFDLGLFEIPAEEPAAAEPAVAG